MIENGASNQREIEQEGAAFFTHFEAIGGDEFKGVAAESGVGNGLWNGSS